MFYVIITSNVVIVMTQKFRLLLSAVFSLDDEMDSKVRLSKEMQISSQTEI